MNTIDLRSDTVTVPTPAMRDAMATAEVGDDVYGEDPTINALQAEAARMFNKEAALFVTSGTQGNLASILAHCQRGDEFIVGKQAHIFKYEAGSASMYGGLQANTLDVQQDGTYDLEAMRRAIRWDNAHEPITRLICLENTHGGASGVPVPATYIREVAQIARDHKLKLHIDGARIFNAAAALNTTVAELTADADSVSFCLSKGLCAPVGSIIVGSHEFMARAFRARKSLGGALRQAGILAAAGMIALTEMSQRLHEDHANARALAEGLAALPYVDLDVDTVQTNMIFFKLTADAPLSVEEVSARLKADYGILARPYSPQDRQFRIVTHYWITREHVEQVIAAFRALLMGERAYSELASD